MTSLDAKLLKRKHPALLPMTCQTIWGSKKWIFRKNLPDNPCKFLELLVCWRSMYVVFTNRFTVKIDQIWQMYHTSTRWWFQIFLIFTPKIGGNDPIWRAYFSNGLKPPTSRVFGIQNLFFFPVRQCYFQDLMGSTFIQGARRRYVCHGFFSTSPQPTLW